MFLNFENILVGTKKGFKLFPFSFFFLTILCEAFLQKDMEILISNAVLKKICILHFKKINLIIYVYLFRITILLHTSHTEKMDIY